MHTFKFLSIAVLICTVFTSNSQASVEMVFNPTTFYINCDGNKKVFNFNSDSSHEIKNIVSKYFTFDSINIDINNRNVIFHNFSNNNGNYDLSIRCQKDMLLSVVMEYKYNEPYLPRIHLKNMKRLYINSNLLDEPKSGEIDDIDSNIIRFNDKLLKNFNKVKVIQHSDTIPTLLGNVMKTCANEIGNTGQIICDKVTPRKLKDICKIM